MAPPSSRRSREGRGEVSNDMRSPAKLTVTCDDCKEARVDVPAPEDSATRQYSTYEVELERSLRLEGWTTDAAGQELCPDCTTLARARAFESGTEAA